MVQIYIRSQDKRKSVIFIHGFGKKYDDWNCGVTKSNKILSHLKIEETLSKNHNTVLVQIEDQDYKKSFDEVVTDLHNKIAILSMTKLTLVAHSYGCLYGLRFAELFQLDSLLLIEPVIKSAEYHQFLKTKATDKDETSVEYHKLQTFHDIPTGSNIKNSTIVRVHVNSDNGEIPLLHQLHTWTNKNMKSRIIVHYKASHMIHYTLPHVIIDSIRELSN